jgi:hypothetical protein
MPQLVSLLRNVVGDQFARDARRVFEYVGACVPTSPTDIDSHWVPADAATDLRAELDSATPRLIHLGTDSSTSATVLVQRAMDEVVTITRCRSAYGAASEAGVPAHQHQDIIASITEAVAATPDEWRADPVGLTAWVRDDRKVVSIDPGPSPDKQLLDSLTAAYPGLPMMVTRRSFTVPAGSENAVYSVAPPIRMENERWALRSITSLNEVLAAHGVAPLDVEGMT